MSYILFRPGERTSELVAHLMGRRVDGWRHVPGYHSGCYTHRHGALFDVHYDAAQVEPAFDIQGISITNA